MPFLDPFLEQALGRADARGLRRRLRTAKLRDGGRIVRDGREMIDFSSNDYLGLSRHSLLIERAREWAERYGAGAGASRLVTGTSEAHLAVEAKVAAFKGTEAALIFGSGWQANAAVIPALVAAMPGVKVFTDRLNHASMHHGCAAAGVRQVRYHHSDLNALAAALAKHADAPARLILTESVFSMDGDRSDMVRLSDIAKRHDAVLYVDEAHATGVLGPRGAGLSATVIGGVEVAMGTFSKALGGFGAYVAGSRLLCDYLVNASGGFIYATAPPPAVLGAIDAALDLVPGMDAERAKLTGLADRLRAGLIANGYDVGESSTQIVPAVVGEADDAMALAARLEAAGMLAAAIRPPTVPAGTSRLRLALRATHDEADIDRLIAAIGPKP
ncbi:8-amino-7-oxononanoate synthase [Croceicoccus naphthovorans]|uniref:8-amino-7-ketopelargonate synthase n=1 Tax=Croceicoccus naphthovorans TaxID=1348774 RepID=A0A0G3XGR8_9SPHN|nr:8-amino-7-oxononanoate synthase [Croceicoccus naphthovorans]AKM10725.1 8-amino-7-oxononanoate synthase [Croceicoccus naphthovorans]MBB3991811.1 8-amino-7-oxononanoate synthase [Croceicoccus naphthovorans]